jgi:CHAT domain-containing protein
VRKLGLLYPDGQLLAGADTTVERTVAALDGAALAHIAAHGDFRTDNPLFSALWLADGPLTIYDLEGMAVAPRTVVLAACDSARHTSQPGDDLLGLAAAFLSLGTTVLIASLVSLPDGQSSGLMLDLHTRLHAGQRPAAALAATQQQAADGDVHAFAAAAGFVCFGAG